ncbi:MAG: GntR family transcriptional regulator [bacterium]|nr:GntR family transcriptional regulator [bacterium]
MQDIATIPTRLNISDEVASVLREMIFDGRLVAGERINEVHLAAILNVSRTPLREALTGLVGEGALYQVPRRGYFVYELSADEVENIYPIRAYLDPEALRLAGLPSSSRLQRLESINRDIAASTGAKEAIQLDDFWHITLWEKCRNPVLTGLIEQFMRRTRRYELALMSERANIEATIGSKEGIIELLCDGDLEAACALLRQRLMNAKEPIIEWLGKRQEP